MILRALDQAGDDFGRIERGFGVRHAGNGGETTRRGGVGTRFHRLLLGKPWIAQVDMDIDPARSDQAPTSVVFRYAIDRIDGSDRLNDPIPDEDVVKAIDPVGRVDDMSPPDEDRSINHAHRPFRGAAAISQKIAPEVLKGPEGGAIISGRIRLTGDTRETDPFRRYSKSP